jgi:RNA polymerase sigma-70 factor (ECF subfamily)
MSDGDDIRLVESFRKGDERAFEALVDKYQKVVFNVAFRIVNNQDDAEDITQSVFIRIFQSIADYDPKHKFYSWLYRIAVNESLNHLKSVRPNDDLDNEEVLDERTPHESFEDKETSGKIEDCLDALQTKYRVVIVLRHFNHLSYKEISDILDLPEKTVKSRLFMARQILKDMLVRKGLDSI